ncbi:hypothetical protein V7147_13215 [Bacillus sp. JJ1521]|uniref:hypothetical protein n=1 Tax=Bacillus sp. JJ1521 TaxID=3122957 RepID=UPI0030002361
MISPRISIDGKEIGYIGYVANETDVDKNEIPSVYKDVEVQKVKPNTKIELHYVDEPEKILLKQWTDGEFTSEEELSGYHFLAPNEEGTYTYNISSSWNYKTASSVVIVLVVEK